MKLHRLEVDDRVDPLRARTELERRLDVSAAVAVDEGVDTTGSRSAQALDQPVAVLDRTDPDVAQDPCAGGTGNADDVGSSAPGQLRSQESDAARSGGDHHGLARSGSNRTDGGPRRGPGDVQAGGDRRIKPFGQRHEAVLGDGDILRLSAALVAHADNRVPHLDVVHSFTDFDHGAGKITSLPFIGEIPREEIMHNTLPNNDLPRIDSRISGFDAHLTRAGRHDKSIADLKHRGIPVFIKSNSFHHAHESLLLQQEPEAYPTPLHYCRTLE